MTYAGTQIGPDGKRHAVGQAPSEEEARAEQDAKVQAMQADRERARLNAASIGNREWGAASETQTASDAGTEDGQAEEEQAEEPVTAPAEEEAPEPAEEEPVTEEAPAEEAPAEEQSEEDAEKAANLEAVADTKGDFPKHKGGGWFVLSDGTLVQGKEDAQKAQSDLGG